MAICSKCAALLLRDPCRGCGVEIPGHRRADALYCSERCQKRDAKRRERARDTGESVRDVLREMTPTTGEN